jgi:hypothetical protein
MRDFMGEVEAVKKNEPSRRRRAAGNGAGRRSAQQPRGPAAVPHERERRFVI